MVEAIHRLIEPPEVAAAAVVAFGVIGPARKIAPPNQTYGGRPAHSNDAYAQRCVPASCVLLRLCAPGRQR